MLTNEKVMLYTQFCKVPARFHVTSIYRNAIDFMGWDVHELVQMNARELNSDYPQMRPVKR